MSIARPSWGELPRMKLPMPTVSLVEVWSACHLVALAPTSALSVSRAPRISALAGSVPLTFSPAASLVIWLWELVAVHWTNPCVAPSTSHCA